MFLISFTHSESLLIIRAENPPHFADVFDGCFFCHIQCKAHGVSKDSIHFLKSKLVGNFMGGYFVGSMAAFSKTNQIEDQRPATFSGMTNTSGSLISKIRGCQLLGNRQSWFTRFVNWGFGEIRWYNYLPQTMLLLSSQSPIFIQWAVATCSYSLCTNPSIDSMPSESWRRPKIMSEKEAVCTVLSTR